MPDTAAMTAMLDEPDADPADLAALDEAWEDEPVTFGPGAASSCKDGLIARIRAGRRPPPGIQAWERAMRDAIKYIVYGWYPYLCLMVFLPGSLIRFDREQYHVAFRL